MSNIKTSTYQGQICPVPIRNRDHIIIGHGSGGKLTEELIKNIFIPIFSSLTLSEGNDFARIFSKDLIHGNTNLAISTDSHVITPLFFPGGDIGRLAVCGTVNDVAMSGAVPKYITAGFILEEGLQIDTLISVVKSMQSSAEEAQVEIIAGDTKVVERGKGDGLYITTAGIGIIPENIHIAGGNALPGDVVIISGTIGDHGIAVLSARNELGFDTELTSDVSPLNHLIHEIINICPTTHVLRDPTRGGLATTLNEIACQSNVNIVINEDSIPVKKEVLIACELLGFDPLYVANEGKVVVFVPSSEAEIVVKAMRNNKYGVDSKIIGYVEKEPKGQVFLKTSIGGTRIIDILSGEMLPRIC